MAPERTRFSMALGGLTPIDRSWVEAALEGMPIMPEPIIPGITPNKPLTPRDPLLTERQKTHGSFEQNAKISQSLKYTFDHFGYAQFNPVHREALDMIALKLSRILSGQSNHKDHWDDIAGYAKLASEACPSQ